MHSSAGASPAPPLDLNCQREPSVAARTDLNCVHTAPEAGRWHEQSPRRVRPRPAVMGTCRRAATEPGRFHGLPLEECLTHHSLPPGFPTLALGVEKYWRRRHNSRPALPLPPRSHHHHLAAIRTPTQHTRRRRSASRATRRPEVAIARPSPFSHAQLTCATSCLGSARLRKPRLWQGSAAAYLARSLGTPRQAKP